MVYEYGCMLNKIYLRAQLDVFFPPNIVHVSLRETFKELKENNIFASFVFLLCSYKDIICISCKYSVS